MAKKQEEGNTIILIQESNDAASRVWDDYETLDLAVEGLLKYFEDEWRYRHPKRQNINYTDKDLRSYLNSFTALAFLCLDEKTASYIPKSKDWIIERALQTLVKIGK